MRGRQRSMVGVVLSDKMQKTVVVAVERRVRHPLYKKIVRQTKKYKAQDEMNTSHAGDLVRIIETRPLSKEKRWRVAEIMTKAEVVDVRPEEIGVPEEPAAEAFVGPANASGKSEPPSEAEQE